jgi:hypothetical protein
MPVKRNALFPARIVKGKRWFAFGNRGTGFAVTLGQ